MHSRSEFSDSLAYCSEFRQFGNATSSLAHYLQDEPLTQVVFLGFKLTSCTPISMKLPKPVDEPPGPPWMRKKGKGITSSFV